jgi:uridine kinase
MIIGVAGGSGSGKTTVVNKIKSALDKRVVVIPQDSYYKDCSHLSEEERRLLNFDHPDAIDFELLIEQLEDIRSGKSIEQPIYSYLTCARDKEQTVHIDPSDIIIVEGILIFTSEKLRNMMDLKIFVDADDDDRLMRVISRDIVERGKDVEWVLERYTTTVKPMHQMFIAPSKRYADVIIPQGGHNSVAIDLILSALHKK